MALLNNRIWRDRRKRRRTDPIESKVQHFLKGRQARRGERVRSAVE